VSLSVSVVFLLGSYFSKRKTVDFLPAGRCDRAQQIKDFHPIFIVISGYSVISCTLPGAAGFGF